MQIVRFTEGSLQESAHLGLGPSGQTHNFTTVFWPIVSIELTYALDKYAGVARGNLFVCVSLPFGSDDAGVELPWAAESDDK